MITALIIFIIAYIAMIGLSKYRPIIAIAAGVIYIVTGMLPVNQILSSINFNVLMMLIGIMGIVELVIASDMPLLIASNLVKKMPNVKWTIVILSLLSGVISAFMDNVATVLMLAPIAMCICKEQNINPVGMLIAISVSSNLQGAATLVGDTTSILLGGYAGMNFNDFFWYKGAPSIFWAVELGAVLSAFILIYLFRKNTDSVNCQDTVVVKDKIPTVFLTLTIVLLIVASFIPNTPEMINGYICMAFMIISLIYAAIRDKSTKPVTDVIKALDYETIILLTGIFLIIGGIKNMGVIDAIASLFTKFGGTSVFVIYTILVWFSVIVSAFIDNIPYVATMLPVVASLATTLNIDPTLLYFGLLSGATLGGNLTPIGASANITAIGILKKNGYEVKNSDFFKIGIPFTLAAIIPAYIYFLIFYY